MNRHVYVVLETTAGWDWESTDIVCAVNNKQEAQNIAEYLTSNIDSEEDERLDIYRREYYLEYCPLVNSLEEYRGDSNA